MKLSSDKQSVRANESLTLAEIPADAFDYRLGSRLALEWVIDQDQVKAESDPNRGDDPGYIVRLVRPFTMRVVPSSSPSPRISVPRLPTVPKE
jgi:predicted helicase